MGLFGYIKRWLSLPLTPNADIVSLTIYVGLIFILAWMWSTVIRVFGQEVG